MVKRIKGDKVCMYCDKEKRHRKFQFVPPLELWLWVCRGCTPLHNRMRKKYFPYPKLDI